MKRISQMFSSMSALSRETVLLPLLICVIMPGMAGAWWRHSHGDPRPRIETSAAVDTCEVPRGTMAVNKKMEVNKDDQ